MVSLGKKARKVLRRAASRLTKNTIKKSPSSISESAFDHQVAPQAILWCIDKPELPHDDSEMTDADKIATGNAEVRGSWERPIVNDSYPESESVTDKARRIVKNPNHSDSLDPCPVPAKKLPPYATIDPVPDIPTPQATPRDILTLTRLEHTMLTHPPTPDPPNPSDPSDIGDLNDDLSDHDE